MRAPLSLLTNRTLLRTGLICSLVLVGALSLFLLQAAPLQPLAIDGNPSLEAEQRHWKGRVESVGPRQAYTEFKDRYATSPTPFTHAIGHQLGDLVFNADDLDGISICDTSFGYACYHQFLARAISKYGISALATLGAHCRNETYPGDCFHGIGHGLQEYFQPPRILEALRACEGFNTFKSSCEQGVFMDFNVPLTFDGVSTPYAAPRNFDVDHPYRPCDTDLIPERYKGKCYEALPHLWFQTYGRNIDSVRTLCDGADTYSAACYRGMTIDMTGILGYDQGRVIAVCESLPSEEDTSACLKATSYYLFILGHDWCYVQARMHPALVACVPPKNP